VRGGLPGRPGRSALSFVVLFGAVSFFADFTYEGSRGMVGQYLGLLGAGALAISVVSGAGELAGYGLRLVSGPGADRTGWYWPVAIAGYLCQMAVVPLLALAGSWPVAALLVVLERVGKAVRNPPRDAMLSHAASRLGYGRAFGLHEALDQLGATVGPLAVSAVLVVSHRHYRLAFALLAVPAAAALGLLGTARLSYPRPAELESRPAAAPGRRLPRAFWVYLSAAALVGAGFADFPLLAYRFERSGAVPADLVPVLYALSMASGGAASLGLGRLFDRFGARLLLPVTAACAAYAPLAFLGGPGGAVAGVVLWGVGSGVQESLVPAFVGEMVAAGRRASAFGTFTAGYGLAWFAGSAVIGLLYGVSVPLVVAFCLASQTAALPLLAATGRREVPPAA
jgi:MFS family permease